MKKDTRVNMEFRSNTFIPSYDKRYRDTVEYIPPSVPEKLMAGLITATVWAGVVFTLPVAYFWFFKKEKENEQILIRRLGKLQTSFTVAGRIPVLPLIDEQVRVDLSEQILNFGSNGIITVDMCCIDVKSEVKWKIVDGLKADNASKDAKKDTEQLIPVFVIKQLSRSTIRQVATEKEKLENKIYWTLNDELGQIGVEVQSVALNITAAKQQPFIKGDESAVTDENRCRKIVYQYGTQPGGIIGAIESVNKPNSIINDILSGMVGHPGFANIISSAIQQNKAKSAELNNSFEHKYATTVLDRANENSPLIEPDAEVIAELIRARKLTINSRFLISGSANQDIIVENSEVMVVSSGTQSAPCIIKIRNSILKALLEGKISYKEVYSNGDVDVSGDVFTLRHLLPLFK